MKKYFKHIIIISFIVFTNAQEFPDSIKKELEHLSLDHKAKKLSELCWKNREKDSDLALVLGKRAIKLATETNQLSLLARTSNFVGVLYLHYKYEFEKAISFFHNSVDAATSVNDTIHLAYAYNNLGDAYYLTGNKPLALEYSKNSLRWFELVNFKPGIAYGYINLGLYHRLDNNYDLALKYFKDAVKLRTEIDHKTGIASAIYEIGKTYYENNKLDSALIYFNQSLFLNKNIENKIYSAKSLNGIGSILYDNGEYSKALIKYQNALQLHTDRNHKYGIISSRLGIAKVYSKTGKISQGEKELKKAFQIAREINVSSKIIETYKIITEFYQNINDYKSAVNYFNDFLQVYDSLVTRTQYATLEEVNQRYSLKRKMDNIERDLEFSNKLDLYLSIIVFLLLFLGSVIFWKYISHRKLNKKLNESNYAKDKLFSIISHDLKNPFFALKNFVFLLKHEDLTKEEKEECLEQIEVTTENTYSLLENLLNLSSSRTGKVDFNPNKFSFDELMLKVIDIIKPLADEKNLQFKLKSSVREIFADKQMFEIIFRNLITNAIKYSNNNDSIIIKSYKENSSIKISVTDNGTGMSNDLAESLFQNDFIKSTRGTSGEKGTGLGLGLSNEFVQKHNGKIEVKSELGKGSEFIVTIPDK